MNIYYDADHQKWYHNNSDHTFFIFGSDELHPLKNGNKTEKEFTVTPKKGKIGPLVGILTGCAADGTYYGNIPLFKNIQMALQAKGGLSFIFCLDGINDNFIDGSIYHIESETWVDARFRYRKLIKSYNFLQLLCFITSSSCLLSRLSIKQIATCIWCNTPKS
ncbi:hypothetical protein N1I87_04165 [Bacillus sp. FSL W8-0102]|uniref:hypothetical protein n=1 Tax=Bacillus sp. FSL W8-0102 TaxID=2978205 RepID=UPI0030F8541D